MPKDIVTEYIPGYPLSPAAQKTITTRSQMVREMERHPGWRDLQAKWDELDFTLRQVITQRGKIGRLREAQALRRVVRAAARVIESQHDAARAVDAGLCIEQPHIPRTDFTEAEANEAVARAERARQMTALPGWSVFLRDFAAMARAQALWLENCSEEDAQHRQEDIDGVRRALQMVQETINLGADAEAWQLAQVEETVKGKERLNG